MLPDYSFVPLVVLCRALFWQLMCTCRSIRPATNTEVDELEDIDCTAQLAARVAASWNDTRHYAPRPHSSCTGPVLQGMCADARPLLTPTLICSHSGGCRLTVPCSICGAAAGANVHDGRCWSRSLMREHSCPASCGWATPGHVSAAHWPSCYRPHTHAPAAQYRILCVDKPCPSQVWSCSLRTDCMLWVHGACVRVDGHMAICMRTRHPRLRRSCQWLPVGR